MVTAIAGASLVLGAILAWRDIISWKTFAVRAVFAACFAATLIGACAYIARLAGRTPPERVPVLQAIASVLLMAAIYGFAVVMLRGTAFGAGVTPFLTMLPVMFGGTLIAAGIGRRVGTSLHCPTCDYEFAFADRDDAPDKCPECGCAWIGRLNTGRREKSTPMIVAGTIIVATIFMMWIPLLFMGSLAPHLPTPLLRLVATQSSGSAHRTWDELSRRPLDADSIRRLAEVAIERRARTTFDVGAGKWLDNMLAAGSLPGDLEERYFRAGFRAELAVPSRVKAGAAFTANLRVAHAAVTSNPCLGVMFAGYTLGDGDEQAGRAEKTAWSHELVPGAFQSKRDAFPHTLKIDRPGECRVRATYWLVYLPSFMDPLQWQPDGTPVPPPGALWFERIDLEKTVIVE